MASLKIFVVLALVAAVSAESQSRIVGGTPTTIQEYPHVISLVYYYPRIGLTVQRCVGCLLSSWHVMTSGFCFTGAVLENMQARAGSTYSLSGGILANLESFIKHPDYAEKPRTHDIAIARTQTPYGISDNVNILYLPGVGTYIPDGTAATVVSWGFEAQGGAQLETLKSIELYKMNLDDCKAAYDGLDTAEITEHVICAAADTKGMCNGDDGAPMTIGQVVVGFSSYYHSCEPNDYPFVFTRVDKFTDWIMDVTRNSGAKSVTLKTAPVVL